MVKFNIENLKKLIFAPAFFRKEFLGNSLGDYSFAFGVFLVSLAALKFFQQWIISKLEKAARKTKTDIDDTFIEIIKSVKPPFYSFLAFWFALRFLELPPFLSRVVDAILLIWIVYQFIYSVDILINFVANKKTKNLSPSSASLLKKVAKGILWSFGILLILSNLGFDVSSLVAGLGIGGIAVALAVQNILSDLFSSFAIYFDKPFEIGDFISVGNASGTVERIGIKTTRLRSSDGEEIVLSNRELTSATIHNYGRLQKRRYIFKLGVHYDTPNELLEKIPFWIEEIVESIKLAQFDRAHFREFGDSALIFEISFYVLSSDFKEYLNTVEKILLKIKGKLEKERIEIAYPTQFIYFQESKIK